MVTNPPSTTRELTRDEFAALARPYRATRIRLIATSLVIGVLLMLVPTILFGGVMIYMAFTITGGLTYRPVMTVVFSHMLPLFLAVQAMYLLLAAVQIGSTVSKGQTRMRRMFPDRQRRETVTTQVMSYGIVQSSAGCSIITPWGYVIRIDEIPGAFVLQTRNMTNGRSNTRWGLGIELVYAPKSLDSSTAPELSVDLLEQFRAASATVPNYTWHAELVGLRAAPPSALTVWPPPPDAPAPAPAFEVPLTGTIILPMVEVSSDQAKLSFQYGLAGKMQLAQGALIMPIVLFVDFYRYLVGPNLYWGIAGGLALSLMSFALAWRSKPIIAIDRERSQLTISGKRFAAASEIHAITVVDYPAVFLFGKTRKPAYIAVSKTTGKPRRLPFLSYSGAYEANVIAMILGQYLTESLRDI